MSLAQALQVTLGAPIEGAGQVAAQREICRHWRCAGRATTTDSPERGARERREVGPLVLQASACWSASRSCTRTAGASRIALGLFSTAIAVSVVLILANDRPFVGPTAVKPTPLLEVLPKPGSPTTSTEQIH